MGSIKFNQIPTKNKVVKITNFPKHDYVVEGDKIYRSLKNTDEFEDVSNDGLIRYNLFKELAKTNFKDYNDDESVIWKHVQNHTFDKYLKQREELVKREQQARELAPKWINASRWRNFESNNKRIRDYLSQERPIILDTDIVNVPEQQEEFIPVVDIPQREELVTDIPQPTKSQTNPPLSLKRVELPKDKSSKEIIEEVYNTQLPKLPEESIETIRIKNPDDKGLLYKLTEPFNRSQYQSAEALKDAITLALNGVGRYWKKFVTGGEGTIARMNIPTDESPQDTTSQGNVRKELKYIPLSYTGDTIKLSPRLYQIPESINVNQYQWGVRNRGEHYNTISTEAAPVTLMQKFTDYSENLDQNRHYIGIDHDGNFKVGEFNIFNPGDRLAPLTYWVTSGFAKDENGNFKHYDAGGGNGNNQMPVLVTPNGYTKINLFSGHGYKNFNPDLFDTVQGGHFLIKGGNETRVVGGSLNQIDQELENLKKRQNVDYVYVYQLDNGPANTGLRTFDKKITGEDWKKYEKRNNRGIGTVMFIKGESPKFKEEQDILKKYLYTTGVPSLQLGGILKYKPTINRFPYKQENITTDDDLYTMMPPPNIGYKPEYNAAEINDDKPIETKSSEKSTTKSKKYSDRQEFVDDLFDIYNKVLQERGIDTRYAKYLVTQDAHETNFGKTYAGNFNFGNITLGSSNYSYNIGNDKDANGKSIKQKFRNYNSLEEYVNDKIDLLNTPKYHAFDGDPSGFFQRVKNGGYAEDPEYVTLLTKLYKQISSPKEIYKFNLFPI